MHRRSTPAHGPHLPVAGLAAVALVLTLGGCIAAPQENGDTVTGIIPAPTEFALGDGPAFVLTEASQLVVEGEGAAGVAGAFAAGARAATGFALPVVEGDAEASDIALVVADGESPGGEPEGYALEAGEHGVRIGADAAAGLFRGTQTLRQLFPAQIERRLPWRGQRRGRWPRPSVEDAPRFAYRGAMLDVARNFFSVAEVKRYIDDIALLKLNALHRHLTDDQGWRLQIDSWPLLAEIGGSTSVAGRRRLLHEGRLHRDRRVRGRRSVTIVPEIDLPGHTNAALASYPELNIGGVASRTYRGIEVGMSNVDTNAEATWRFVEDVVRELAELTPGPYIHLGGDESLATSRRRLPRPSSRG